MSDIILDVESRDAASEKNKKLRREGVIPAVIYGHGIESKSIKLPQSVFLKKMHGHLASNVFIDLKIDGEANPSKTVFIKEVSRDPFSHHDLIHVDFMEIKKGELIHMSVPVELIGTPVGVSQGGGMVEFHVRAIDIECMPRHVPKDIQVDVAGLNVGEAIHAGDLQLSEDLKLLTAGEVTIVAVAERSVKAAESEKAEAEETPDAAQEEKKSES